jgi:hypothetical protein
MTPNNALIVYLTSILHSYLLYAGQEKSKTEALVLAIIWPVSLAMFALNLVYLAARKGVVWCAANTGDK